MKRVDTNVMPPPGADAGHSNDEPQPGYVPAAYTPPDYLPPGYGEPAQPPTPRRREGLLGLLGAAVAAIAKFGGAALAFLAKGGFIFLKLFKFGGTAISMLISAVIFATIFGPVYGLGVLALIAVHESGHMLMAWTEHVPVTTPIFLGPLGAFIKLKTEVDARQEAVIAIGGPLVGTLGAYLVFAAGTLQPVGRTHYLLLAIAYFGFLINLFNLIPLAPFDGGRVTGALSPWTNVVGLAIMVPLLLAMAAGGHGNPLVFLLVIGGAINLFRKFRDGMQTPELPGKTKAFIGIAYLGVLAFAAFGMSETLAQLQLGGYGQ